MSWCGPDAFTPTWAPATASGAVLTRCFQDTVLQVPLDVALLASLAAAFVRLRQFDSGRIERSIPLVIQLVAAALLTVVASSVAVAVPAVRVADTVIASELHFVLIAVVGATIAALLPYSASRGMPLPWHVVIVALVRLPFSAYEMYAMHHEMLASPGCPACKGHIAVFAMYILVTGTLLVRLPPRARFPAPTEADGLTQFERVTIRRYCTDFVTRERARVVIGGVVMLACTIISVGQSILFGRLVGDVKAGTSIVMPVATLGGILLLSAIGNSIAVYVLNAASERAGDRFRLRFMSRILRREMAFFDNKFRVGDTVSRVSNDVVVAGGLIDYHGIQMVAVAVSAFVFIIAMLALSWQITLVMLAPIPVGIVLQVVLSRIIESVSTEQTNRDAEVGALADELFANFATVRASNMAEVESARFESRQMFAFDLQWRLVVLFGLTELVLVFIINVAILMGLWYGSTLVLNGDMSIGHLTSFMFVGADLVSALSVAPGIASLVAQALGSIRILRGLMFQRNGMPDRGDPIGGIKGHVEFSDVSFRYKTRDTQSLSHVSFEAKPGQMIAFVGQSGSGKSTIAALTQRLYDSDLGVVMIDRRDLSHIRPTSLREAISVVSQEPVLFESTVLYNVTYGDSAFSAESFKSAQLKSSWRQFPDISPLPAFRFEHETRANEAIKQASARDFVENMPHGVHTHLLEAGSNLSGGQKQRIAIARALYRRPALLILDEATSALDVRSERQIQHTFDKLRRSRQQLTVLVIAHRLSTVVDADRIIVMRAGSVVEAGTHADLMSLQGEYFELQQRQMRHDEAEAHALQAAKEAAQRTPHQVIEAALAAPPPLDLLVAQQQPPPASLPSSSDSGSPPPPGDAPGPLVAPSVHIDVADGDGDDADEQAALLPSSPSPPPPPSSHRRRRGHRRH